MCQDFHLGEPHCTPCRLGYPPHPAASLCYQHTVVTWYRMEQHIVERVQTGVRMEKRLLKVLRAFADYHDLTLGDLLEGIVLHAFDGKCPFSEDSLRRIKELKKIYGLDLDASASHRLAEAGPARSPKKRNSAK
jgi:hypothetical protein